jgi:hypothetical protein
MPDLTHDMRQMRMSTPRVPMHKHTVGAARVLDHSRAANNAKPRADPPICTAVTYSYLGSNACRSIDPLGYRAVFR